jgi:transcriptional regulator with XRE-family HTH domain
MLDTISVGKQIACLRKQKGLTQEELAEKLEITAQAISKWENGHTLPETVLLPLLAELFCCSIDSILMPSVIEERTFREFTSSVGGKPGELALLLYQRMKNKFDFTISYDDKYYVFAKVSNGASAKFNNPNKDDFIIRMDVEANPNSGAPAGGIIVVRLSLTNCSKYMHIIEKMPEHIKKNFMCSDCNSCTCNCPYLMAYTFEGVDYKQCHFITISLDSNENMECIFSLICAEKEANNS